MVGSVLRKFGLNIDIPAHTLYYPNLKFNGMIPIVMPEIPDCQISLA